ncbi:Solute carrier family 25 member 51 [Thelohanellus kitauei]|uniref:Solute carrier family 25 member 51 n=1 Tax=Thelohanellus kitauei TaxID=669202 RepID=A0A0C2JFJ4_THEKT|nr:Solute carrier family 25 member 51 [Thelohanellus kitauei]
MPDIDMKQLEQDAKSDFKRGAFSACASIFIVYPISKLSIRQSLEGVTANSAFQKLKYEGIVSLYRGIGPPLVQKTAAISMMYGFFAFYKSLYSKLLPEMPEFLLYTLAGCTSGTIEVIFTPLERVQTLLTCPRHAMALNNMVSGSLYIFKYYPFKEFYRGWQAVLLRNCVSTALFFYIRDEINAHWPVGKYENLKNFMTGAALGCTMSTLCYPINATRIHMQSELGDQHPNLKESFSRLFNQRNRSIRGLYFGGGTNALRSLISWGIINTMQQYLVRNNIL